ncbi:hypothetical protein [Nitrospirillum iridis]|uniref:Uncharacterized protein n=1 Tax=Nitrospirillum iridis TaxID=765888 RepID=A0A7X0EBL0_9PROT|nr:hypothetical protein [Nitrospirillum iridis]MBB6250693.1 hypothetical protein [Nitrospirillum iridis]
MTARSFSGAGGALSRVLLGLLSLVIIALLMHRPSLEVASDGQGRTCTVVRVMNDPDTLPPTVVAKPGPPSFGPDAYGD